MSALLVVVTAEQAERLEAICASSGFSPDAQVGAMIDLEFEEWQDSLKIDDGTKSTRFARFVAQDKGAL